MEISPNNVFYWVKLGMDSKEWWVLERIKRGEHPVDRRFEIAHLIALDCVLCNGKELSLTEKGLEGLEFFREDYCPIPAN